MFDSIYSNGINTLNIIMMSVTSLFLGLYIAFITSIKVKSRKEFFITISIFPIIVSLVFLFLNAMIKDDTTTTTTLSTVMIGMGLIRFRSFQGRSDEMLLLFLSVAIGVISGLGYIGYAIIFGLTIPLIIIILMSSNILKNSKMQKEKLLKITIPENLEYNSIFDDAFKKYLKEVEMVGVKTTGMGTMFRLSYRIIMLDNKMEKALIDDLRIKNGNLEISILPYVEYDNIL